MKGENQWKSRLVSVCVWPIKQNNIINCSLWQKMMILKKKLSWGEKGAVFFTWRRRPTLPPPPAPLTIEFLFTKVIRKDWTLFFRKIEFLQNGQYYNMEWPCTSIKFSFVIEWIWMVGEFFFCFWTRKSRHAPRNSLLYFGLWFFLLEEVNFDWINIRRQRSWWGLSNWLNIKKRWNVWHSLQILIW